MIEFKNISISFQDKKIFENFNLKINKGEKILFNAPSGSGKSTIFKLLLGFLTPDSGSILFNGKPVDKNNIREIRSRISYVSQDIEFMNEKVETLVSEIFSYYYNKNKQFNVKKFERSLTYFNLNKDILEKKMEALSGGERQRIGLIISILLDRDVWILDEITSALDIELKEKVVKYIIESDKTVLVISHEDIWKEQSIFRVIRW